MARRLHQIDFAKSINSKVGAHYFEEGNVQLDAKHECRDSTLFQSPDDSAVSLMEIIRHHETEYLTSLQASYSNLPDSTFKIESLGAKAGVVLNPATSLSTIEYVLDVVDLVLIMSVNPGFGGQSFIKSQVKKIFDLRRMCVEKGVNPWIEVDGGVTPANAYKVYPLDEFLCKLGDCIKLILQSR